jgi:hypothetical protein
MIIVRNDKLLIIKVRGGIPDQVLQIASRNDWKWACPPPVFVADPDAGRDYVGSRSMKRFTRARNLLVFSGEQTITVLTD